MGQKSNRAERQCRSFFMESTKGRDGGNAMEQCAVKRRVGYTRRITETKERTNYDEGDVAHVCMASAITDASSRMYCDNESTPSDVTKSRS